MSRTAASRVAQAAVALAHAACLPACPDACVAVVIVGLVALGTMRGPTRGAEPHPPADPCPGQAFFADELTGNDTRRPYTLRSEAALPGSCRLIPSGDRYTEFEKKFARDLTPERIKLLAQCAQDRGDGARVNASMAPVKGKDPRAIPGDHLRGPGDSRHESDDE